MPEEQLANKLWKVPGADLSNIGSKYTPMIQISNLPKETTKKYLKKAFTSAKSIRTQTKDNHVVAVLEFQNPVQAAKAYKAATNMKFEKFDLLLKAMAMQVLLLSEGSVLERTGISRTMMKTLNLPNGGVSSSMVSQSSGSGKSASLVLSQKILFSIWVIKAVKAKTQNRLSIASKVLYGVFQHKEAV
ncbi:unnamed protein product [Allacma fusca]|uniref:RRM domain-containing protein n=1 Tax=Allacma fusca TaxID=39272 RepID=A0A8J2LRS4_9HEXA|nr:unnamed protein product [Allacma fusca]